MCKALRADGDGSDQRRLLVLRELVGLQAVGREVQLLEHVLELLRQPLAGVARQHQAGDLPVVQRVNGIVDIVDGRVDTPPVRLGGHLDARRSTDGELARLLLAQDAGQADGVDAGDADDVRGRKLGLGGRLGHVVGHHQHLLGLGLACVCAGVCMVRAALAVYVRARSK